MENIYFLGIISVLHCMWDDIRPSVFKKISAAFFTTLTIIEFIRLFMEKTP